MTSRLQLGRKLKQAGVLMILVTAMLASTSSPASAYAVATASGSVGIRTPDMPAFPNKCYSKKPLVRRIRRPLPTAAST